MISVIIASYNNAPYISKCLDSIISNTYKDLEIIVVDDCSKDDSINVINRYINKDNRIRLIQNEVNVGAGLTRRRGIKEASGEWISLIDADDWINHDYFSTLLSYVTDDSIDMVYGHYNGHDIIEYKPPFMIPDKKERLLSIKQNGLQFLNASLTKRKLYDDIEYCDARIVEDTPTAIKLLYKADNIYVTPYKGYNWRTNNQSLTHKTTEIKLMTNIFYNCIEPLRWLFKRDISIAMPLKADFEKDLKKFLDKPEISTENLREYNHDKWSEILDYYSLESNRTTTHKIQCPC